MRPPRTTVLAAAATCLAATAVLASPQLNPNHITPDRDIDHYRIPQTREPKLSHQAEVALLRKDVKYVFVLYQENRSFDSYFGTFPGAEGLFSHPASHTLGFNQTLIDTDGKLTTVHPFRIGPAQFASDTDDIDHSHPAIVYKMDIVDGKPRMDRFAQFEEQKRTHSGNPSLEAKQFGELAMAYEDGDTIPLLWRYANRFVLFDHIFQQMTGPSTPGNLAIIGAQTGATQWIRHPELVYDGNGAGGPGVPMMNDAAPLWGSPGHEIDGLAVNPKDFAGKKKQAIQDNLTFATLPLTLAKSGIKGQVSADADPKNDLEDVGDDIDDLAKSPGKSVAWGWYQEGYDREPTDPKAISPVDPVQLHTSYVTHHNGPQYFGYIANNPKMRKSLHGMEDFYHDLQNHALPAQGGVFYVKGGHMNILGLKPADPKLAARNLFLGDDDHPDGSDSQISEAQIAECINRIAASPYWKHCAIIITWDDSEGDYDHVPPPVRTHGPDGSLISDGPRVPLLLISPYSRVQTVAHEQGDHASVVKFVDTVFNLKPLADLPDEKAARDAAAKRGLMNEGPFDDLTDGVTDLLSAFDPARLAGRAPALPASYVEVPENLIFTLPQQSGYGWRQVGVEPTDYRLGIVNEIPKDFNPRPKTEPTVDTTASR
jgi:phospholipase C